MALFLSNSFESGQSNGTAISGANSGGGAGASFDSVSAGVGAAAVFSSTAIHGSLSGLFTTTTTSTFSRAVWTTALGGTFSRLQFRVSLKPNNLTPATVAVLRFQAGGSQAARLTIDSTGNVTFRNASSSSVASSASTMTTSDKWVVTGDVVFGPGTGGSGTIHIYHSATGTVPDETLSFSSANLLSSAIDEVDWGIAASVTGGSVVLDDIIVTDQGEPGPPVTSGVGTAALGGVTAAGTGRRTVRATGAAALGSVTAGATGRATVKGSGTGALGALTAAATGSVNSTVVSGMGSAALGGLTAAGHGPTVVSGAGAALLGALTAAGGGSTAAVQYLFTPPQRTMTSLIVGSLRWSYPVSETVWKDGNGVWQHQETPASDDLLGAQLLLSVSGRPEVVSAAVAAELVIAGIGTVEAIT